MGSPLRYSPNSLVHFTLFSLFVMVRTGLSRLPGQKRTKRALKHLRHKLNNQVQRALAAARQTGPFTEVDIAAILHAVQDLQPIGLFAESDFSATLRGKRTDLSDRFILAEQQSSLEDSNLEILPPNMTIPSNSDPSAGNILRRDHY
ncbi:hypothetical protein P5V15_001707 [Pogonomyrmex californicus]